MKPVVGELYDQGKGLVGGEMTHTHVMWPIWPCDPEAPKPVTSSTEHLWGSRQKTLPELPSSHLKPRAQKLSLLFLGDPMAHS